MPFRINYTGRAALQTFFRVKPATLLEGTIPAGEENAKEGSTEADETQNTDADDNLDGQTDVTNSETTRPAPTSTKIPTSSLGARFTAAFRGRTMKGVTVNLPEGYEGIVFHADDEIASGVGGAYDRVDREEEKPKRGRRGRKAEIIAIEEDVDMEEDGNGADEEDAEEKRILKPTAQFSSFVLWNPDFPVDPSRDEYLRSLTEWTKLAAEVSVSIFKCLKVR